MLLHEQQLFRVPGGLTDEQAVMLEPVAVALHAVLRHLPRPGDRVLIIGAGTVGLLVQQIVRALVPQCEVSVLARYTFQVEQATRLGAAHIIYPRDAYEGVQHATNAKLYNGMFGNKTLQGGYDVIYDTVGQKRGLFQRNTLHHALRWIRPRGTIVLVGLSLEPMSIDLTPLWQHEISLLGSLHHGTEYWPVGSHDQTSTFRVACELMQQRRITPEQLITHHFALDNYQNALSTAYRKADSRAIKVVFDYSLLPASVVPNVRASAPRIRRQSTINFMEEYDDADEQPARTSGKLGDQKQDIPSARPYTKELAKSPRQDKADDEFDDDDTATAIPAIGKHYTGHLRPYVPQSQMQGTGKQAEQQHNESIPIPANSQHPGNQEEMEAETQRIPQVSLIPHTEANLNLDSDATTLISRASLSSSEIEDDTPDHPAEADTDGTSGHDDTTPEVLHTPGEPQELSAADNTDLTEPEVSDIEHPAASVLNEGEAAQDNQDNIAIPVDTVADEEIPAEVSRYEDQLAIPVEKHYSDTDVDPEQAIIETEQVPNAAVLTADEPDTEVATEHATDPSTTVDPDNTRSTTEKDAHELPETEHVPTVNGEEAPAIAEEPGTIAPDQSAEIPAPPPGIHTGEASVEEHSAENTATILDADALQQVEGRQTKRVQQRSRNRKKKAGSR
ncbi:hypothetical protein KDAU_19090 [Dictyobacter aurantiacus]|uniref:Alcohol dehydrogenase-like C-terminal domain-containing protein n=2 Tax=Dictyobacter aurantiacus TaxID=1936993 RepID=A0A401ZCF8_9CHLR|nr:hypothetical protein KDAU_19090 [Dictyobacter aurantiacus]